MNENHEILSPQGEQRREHILQLAMREAKKRRRNRAAKFGIVCVIFIAAGISMLRLKHEPNVREIVHQTPSAETSHIVISYIQTDPTLLEKFALRTHPHWRNVDDDEFLKEL